VLAVIVEAVANWCEVRSWTRRKNGKTDQSVREPRDVKSPCGFGDGVSLNILHVLADRQTEERTSERAGASQRERER
jgi:hypothetical protein